MEYISDSGEYALEKRHILTNLNNEKNDFIDYNNTADEEDVVCDPIKDSDLRVCRQGRAYFPGYENMQREVPTTQNPLCQYGSQEQADFDYGTGYEYGKPGQGEKDELIDKSGREAVSTDDSDSFDHPQNQQQKSTETTQCPDSPTLYVMSLSQSLDPQNQYQMTVQPSSPSEYQPIHIKVPQDLPPVLQANDEMSAEKPRKKRKTEKKNKKTNTKVRGHMEEEQEELFPFFSDEDLEACERFSQELNEAALPGKLRNKKSAQNHRRNGPGLSTMRSRASQATYFDLLERGFTGDVTELSRVIYIDSIIREYNLSPEELNEYKALVRKLQLQGKTWENVKKNLGSNRVFASIFVSCIIALFSPIGKNDFEAWMRQGVMSSGKITLRDDKPWFRAQFCKKFDHLDLVQLN